MKRQNKEQKQEQQDLQEKAAQEAKERALEIRSAFSKVSQTQEGAIVFRHLMNICGFKLPSLVRNSDGDILFNSSLYNETRRTVYLEVRKLIPNKRLNQIEKETDS